MRHRIHKVSSSPWRTTDHKWRP